MENLPNETEYPLEALEIGTLVRSIKKDRLGMIADAYYGGRDEDNRKIIVYTILLIPDKTKFSYQREISEDRVYLINEYEYDIYAYLMVPPVDFMEINNSLGGII
jgi:hypothetical protein